MARASVKEQTRSLAAGVVSERQHLPLVDVATRRITMNRLPCAGLHDKLFTGSPMLSTESLHRPVPGLGTTTGLDPQLPCPLRDRDRWPAQDLAQFFRGDAPLAAEHPLYLPHLLSLGHHLPFK